MSGDVFNCSMCTHRNGRSSCCCPCASVRGTDCCSGGPRRPLKIPGTNYSDSPGGIRLLKVSNGLDGVIPWEDWGGGGGQQQEEKEESGGWD